MENIEIDYQSEKSWRAKIVLWLLETSVPIHAKLNGSRVAWDLKSKDFLEYSEGTLGNVLGQFYQNYKLEPIAKAERHDVFHVLLNYSTHVTDEAAMQYFLLGNGKPSFFTTGTCVITALLFPDKLAYFIQSYKKGKQCTSIRDWNFKELLDKDLRLLQQKLFNPNTKKSNQHL